MSFSTAAPSGRPKKRALEAGDIEDHSYSVALRVYMLAPEQHRKPSNPSDPLGIAWQSAIKQTLGAGHELNVLANLLRTKAGMETREAFRDPSQDDASTDCADSDAMDEPLAFRDTELE